MNLYDPPVGGITFHNQRQKQLDYRELVLQSYCGFAFDAGMQIAELERKLAAVTCPHNWERVYGSVSDGTDYWTGTKKCTRCGALR